MSQKIFEDPGLWTHSPGLPLYHIPLMPAFPWTPSASNSTHTGIHTAPSASYSTHAGHSPHPSFQNKTVIPAQAGIQ